MNKQITIIAVLLTIYSLNLNAQITFQKTYSFIVLEPIVWSCPDGEYIVTGTIQSTDTSRGDDVFVMKTNANGDTLWTKTFNWTKLDKGACVRPTSDGGYAVVGCINYLQNPPDPISKYLLIRLNSMGDTLWTRTYERPKRCVAQWVEQTTDGGFVLTGYAADWGTSADVYIVKTDNLGNQLWTKAYQLYGEDQGVCIRQTNDGGYILFAGSLTLGSPYYYADTWLLKLNSNGDTVWTRIFPYGRWNVSGMVEQTTDNGYILAVNGNLIKTDSVGIVEWIDTTFANNSGGCNPICSFVDVVQQTVDGGYISKNRKNSGLWKYLAKTNFDGDSLWTLTTKNTYIKFFRQTKDGGYILSGNYPGWTNLSLIKTDCLGNSTFWDSTNCPLPCSQLTATTNNDTTIKLGGTALLNASGGDSCSWFPTTNVVNPNSCNTTANPTQTTTYVVTVKDTNGCIGTDSITVTVDSSTSIYSIVANSQRTTIISPNPFTHSTTIRITNNEKGIKNYELKVYDVLGQTVHLQTLISKQETLNLDLPSGIYFYKLNNDKKEIIGNGKLVIQ